MGPQVKEGRVSHPKGASCSPQPCCRGLHLAWLWHQAALGEKAMSGPVMVSASHFSKVARAPAGRGRAAPAPRAAGS